MIFLHKNKINSIEQGILNEIKIFSNTYPRFKKIKSTSIKLFKDDWKSGLKKLISSNEIDDKNIYEENLDKIFEYDKASASWFRVKTFLASHLSLDSSAEDVEEAVELSNKKHEIYSDLEKFGEDGLKLKEKFKKRLEDIDLYKSEEPHLLEQNSEDTQVIEEVPLKNSSDNKILIEENNSTEGLYDSRENPIKFEGLKRKSSIISPEENRQHLENFQKKLGVAKMKDNIANSYPKNSEANEKTSSKGVEDEPISGSLNWNFRHLYLCDKNYQDTQNILSLIAIEKNLKSLEKYEHYPILIDLAKHIVSSAEKVLAEKSSSEYKSILDRYKGDGLKSPEELLEYYKSKTTEFSTSSEKKSKKKNDNVVKMNTNIKLQSEKLRRIAG